MTEKQIENQILSYLATRKECFAFKFKDQAKFIGGRYRKSNWEINGVADLCCLMDNGLTLWLEVKTDKGKQSKNQKNFEKIIKKHKGYYHVVRSVEETRKIIETYADWRMEILQE